MYITRRTRSKRHDESFLSSIDAGSGDAYATVLKLLACREPKEIRTWRNYAIMVAPRAASTVIDILRSDVAKNHVAFGDVDGTYFVAAPYSRERLIKNLIRSSKKFREVQRHTRLILDESDLLNVHREFPKDRAYKDDE